MSNNDGPSKIEIPARSYTSCSGCKFFKQQLLRSGHDPVYNYNCTFKKKIESEEEYNDAVAESRRELTQLLMGRQLQKNMWGIVETPEWCPFLNNKYPNGSTLP